MVEHTSIAADEPTPPDAEPAPHASFEELVAGSTRLVREAAARPVRIDGPNGETLVLVDVAAFDRLSRPRPRARHTSEWTAWELELLRAQPLPTEAAEFDDEGVFVGHD